MQNIGEQIRNARKAKNMTQDTLAEILNVTRSSVANWELGRRQPDIDMMRRISEVLGVHFEDDSSAETAAAEEGQTTPAVKREKKGLYALIALILCVVLAVGIAVGYSIKTRDKVRPYKNPEGEIFTIDSFKAEAENAAGKAYLTVNPTLTVNHGENYDYWMFTFDYLERNGIALSIDRIEQVYFSKHKENVEMILTAADLRAYGLETEISAYGDFSYTGGLPVQDSVWGVGVLLRCTDENGEKLAFTAYIPFS